MFYEDSAEWFCWTRREDIPISWAGDTIPGGAAAHPGDVVLCVKRYMSDAMLSQDVELFLHAGSSFRLPEHPQSWQRRTDFSTEYLEELGKLLDEVKVHYPDKIDAVAGYVQAWVQQPRAPLAPPTSLPILNHRYAKSTLPSLPCADALQEATTAVSAPKVVRVRRARAPAEDHTPTALPLHAYIAFRESQGVDAAVATVEWNGAWTLHGSEARV